MMRARRRFGVGLACLLAASPIAAFAQDGDEAQRAAQEKAAKSKLDAVREQLKALAAEQRQTVGERGDAARTLRAQELALAKVASDVRALDAKIVEQEAKLAALDGARGKLETALTAQREALAALLRSAYATGNHAELKLLLQQDDVARIARALAYHRYFQRAQMGRIDALLGDLKRLVDLENAIRAARTELSQSRESRKAEGEQLEDERAARATLLGELDDKLKDQRARAAALGKDEQAMTGLLEKLRDVFADIPKQLTGAEPFAAAKGKLPWPVSGKMQTAFGAVDEAGRKSSGVVLAAKNGSPVRAISHGRIAFADWLRGYGLLVIVDHGDGYMSLYGYNETLAKDVGDWVDAGDTLASSGASGGQKTPGVYFELRLKGQPIDPRGWMR